MINIGLFGLGFVGQGVVEILNKNADHLSRRLGTPVRIKTVCVRDVTKRREVALAPDIKVTDKIDDILTDSDIQIVVEVMGGEFPAYDIIKKALQSDKYVVTANKEVVAKHKTEFFKLASDHKKDIYFEAAVGGGIPLIRAFKVGYAANQIKRLYGILNGTTNYILTKIEDEGRDFEDVLTDAQRLGFAEADPSMDVDGLDVAYKLVILAGVAFKADVTLQDLHYEGITSIGLSDIQFAKQLGYRIKLLAIGQLDEQGGLNLRVHPTMVPLDHPIASVRNELNAVFLEGDFVGESMLEGKGAGGLPTASAVVSDIIDIGFDLSQHSRRNLEQPKLWDKMVPLGEVSSRFYLRLRIQDAAGVLEKITHVFGQRDMSIQTIFQHESDQPGAQLVIVTHHVKESQMAESLEQLAELSAVFAIESVVRVDLD